VIVESVCAFRGVLYVLKGNLRRAYRVLTCYITEGETPDVHIEFRRVKWSPYVLYRMGTPDHPWPATHSLIGLKISDKESNSRLLLSHLLENYYSPESAEDITFQNKLVHE
jgi:hypothetical protein